MDDTAKGERTPIATYVAFGISCVVAVAMIAFFPPPRGDDDPDDYLLFAKGIAGGKQGPHEAPSAFRPPGYPLLLAAIIRITDRHNHYVFFLHVVLTLLTLAAVWRMTRLATKHWIAPGVAAMLVAVDPILVYYAVQVMTETLFTTLVCWTLVPWLSDSPKAKKTLILNGLIAGYGFLTRPTMGPIFLGIGIALTSRRKWGLLRGWSLSLAFAAMVVLPWAIRNAILLGSPIIATTHGGYTLWLANNPNFYDAEVVGGRLWAGKEFEDWERKNRDDYVDAIQKGEAIDSELGRDRFQRDQAIRWMRMHRGQAIHAAGYRLRCLWSPITRVGPEPFRSLVPIYYFALFAFAACGWCVVCGWRGEWLVATMAILALTIVHTIYWSNMRFRAPIEPLLAVWAAAAIGALSHRFRPAT